MKMRWERILLPCLFFAFLQTGCGGGSSSPSPNPIPLLQSISPASVAAGSSSQVVTITGSGFLASSTVTFNGVAHTASFVNAGQLNLTLSAADLATVGNFPIAVTNSAPGGGTSTAAAINVWTGLADATGGFSALFPPAVYSLNSSNSPSNGFDLASSPGGVAIGGAVPAPGSGESSSGFDINIFYATYSVSGTFDVNAYISATYPGRVVGSATATTLGGQPAFAVTFQQEEGGGHPYVIAYHSGYVYEIRYDSTANVTGFSDAPGLSVFNQIIQNFTFTR